MSTKREPSAAEVETLQAVLTKTLDGAYPQEMTDLAIAAAKSIKAAFDELYVESQARGDINPKEVA